MMHLIMETLVTVLVLWLLGQVKQQRKLREEERRESSTRVGEWQKYSARLESANAQLDASALYWMERALAAEERLMSEPEEGGVPCVTM